MRILPFVLLAAVPVTAACVAEGDGEDLGVVVDGKGDAAIIDQLR